MQTNYFGTDGVRGRVGGGVMNPEFVLKLGWAAGRVLSEKFGKTTVLIGKDTRISGYLLESVLEAGLSAAGVNAWMLGPMPTPGIAYLTRTFRAQAGVVISASHNPYYDNGIKFFSAAGYKLSAELERAIEQKLTEKMTLVDAADLGKAKRIDDAPGRYIEFCKSTFNGSLAGLKIIIDCANGATYQVAPNVFRELGAEVVEVAAEPNGFNINTNCGSTHPQNLVQAVVAQQADLGIAFDGDGDRVIMVDHTGEIVDGDELLYIIASSLVKRGVFRGGVVGTVMSNRGLEEGLAALNVPFLRSRVGDKYVIELLQSNQWVLGGEPSGHLACLNLTTTGDGIIAALQVLGALMYSEADLHSLKVQMRKYPQILTNLHCQSVAAVQALQQDERLQKLVVQCTQQLGERGKILLRPSGTEPVIRLLVEGEKLEEIQQVTTLLAAQVAELIGAKK